MTSFALSHHNGSLSAPKMDTEIFPTAPIFQLHIVKVIMKLKNNIVYPSITTTIPCLSIPLIPNGMVVHQIKYRCFNPPIIVSDPKNNVDCN